MSTTLHFFAMGMPALQGKIERLEKRRSPCGIGKARSPLSKDLTSP
ncbi:MAG: hypothetical protein QNJ64_12965 [Crocosphaera sp.]|nr:hypothetical protein [Crocosphaera sp.]